MIQEIKKIQNGIVTIGCSHNIEPLLKHFKPYQVHNIESNDQLKDLFLLNKTGQKYVLYLENLIFKEKNNPVNRFHELFLQLSMNNLVILIFPIYNFPIYNRLFDFSGLPSLVGGDTAIYIADYYFIIERDNFNLNVKVVKDRSCMFKKQYTIPLVEELRTAKLQKIISPKSLKNF